MREYTPTRAGCCSKANRSEAGDAKALAEYRRAVQMVFQDPFSSLNPAHTIAYHLVRPLRLHQRELKGIQIRRSRR